MWVTTLFLFEVTFFNTRGKAAKELGVPEPKLLNVDIDMPIDPNEPTYCICNRVSFGEMVGCDNPDVRPHAHTYAYAPLSF